MAKKWFVGILLLVSCVYALPAPGCGAVIVAQGIEEDSRVAPFLPVVKQFLRSVADRDRAAFLAFFEGVSPFYALLPPDASGDREFHDVKAFLATQEGLFGSNPPKITQELRRVFYDGGTLGVAHVLVTVEPPGTGRKFLSYVAVTFALQGDRWVIVHLQNSVRNGS